jgi:FkbM family methyltransferase
MSYDWTGVLVEPLPDMFEKLIENYSLKGGLKFENSAIARDQIVTIHRVPPEKIGKDGIPDWAEGCSTMVPKIHIEDIVPHMIEQEVRGITIQQLYEKYDNKFDFIQIDTEGYDYEIFIQLLEQGFSANLLKIEIAHITYTTAVWMRWKLKEAGYETFIDGYDLIAFRF